MGEILRMQGITKIYDNGFVANKDVTFSVNEKEILALVGENGAGKTTLMKILFGMEQPQGGQIFINGKEVKFQNPVEAIEAGVGMVHQHFMQVPSLTVAENVVLGIEPTKGLRFDMQKAIEMTQAVSDKYDLHVDAKARVADLSIGQRQKVEIIKVLVRDAKILVLDEPTAVLTPQETEELFQQIKVLKQMGHSIIFISHKLDEVMRLCDRVTVLRRGRIIGSESIENLSETKISRMMVGRDVITTIDKEKAECKNKILECKDVICLNDEGRKSVNGVSFSVHQGEILGIAGVEGNGQNEIALAITGMGEYAKGSIKVNGQEIKGHNIQQIRQLGVAHISEDRMIYGSAGDLSIKENLIADRMNNKEFKKGPFIDTKKVNTFADKCIEEYEIACDNRDEPIRMLSGGNMQKVIVAREFTSGANLIVANQPTRGVDIGTCDMIRRKLVDKTRNDGVGALLISADLNEVLEVSDRLLVFYKGKVAAFFKDVKKVSEEELGEYMLGLKSMSKEEIMEAVA